MRVPISWLKEYVSFEDSPRGLADRLTFSGTEVEGIETIGATYDGIVVGEVLQVDRHPNADKLTLCAVNFGAGRLTVVCGAPNVRAGGKYPFAPSGTTLPTGLKLKKAKIRGVESEGMLCAEDELGLSKDHAGLMELDAAWAPGTPLSEVLGPPETVLDLEITPNRPDCLCMIGIAREVAAMYGVPLKLPAIEFTEAGAPASASTRVDVEDTDGCPRYTARILRGVKIGPSPAWMKRRLEAAGVRSINNVVDITNYVMLECGQPLHAFDQTLLREGRIVVRRARAGDQLATLDGIGRPLNETSLLIADAERPVALAGIMGGAGSEIQDTTTTVLLESASFKPAGIRATSRRIGLSTESSYRFERGVDAAIAEWASRRAAQLMQQCASAEIAPGVVDVYPAPRAPQTVNCRYGVLQSVLGIPVEAARVQQIFNALELTVVKTDETSCTVKIPTFRGDVEREIDLAEEFARIHGLDKIPTPSPRAELVPGADDRPIQALQLLRDRLAGLGLTEIMNYSFVSDALLDLLDRQDTARRVRLPNPISADHALLRNSLVPQMLETLGRNAARQVREATLFEMGRVFFPDAQGRATEETRVAVGLMGPAGRTGMDRHNPVTEEDMFLWAKGLWESLTRALRTPALGYETAETAWTEPGKAVALKVSDQRVGLLGLVKSHLRKEWRISEPVAVLEFTPEPLLTELFKPRSFTAVAAYPSVSRDMALVVNQSIRHENIEEIIKKHATKDLESVVLFDIFSGEGIGAGKKSLAYSLTYRSLERTLTDEDANRYHETVKSALKRELEVEIREG